MITLSTRRLRGSTALCASLSVLAFSPLALAEVNENTKTETKAETDEGDTIIVTASPLFTTIEENIVGTSVLDGDDLQRQSAATLGDALRLEPGISTTFFGNGASRPIIRGLDGDRVRILDNGVGTIDAAAASPDHAVAATTATAERVEIVRGTGLLRYGSSGAGGVVNVIDGRLPSEVPEDGIDGGVFVGATSVDNGEEAAGAITATLGRIGEVDIVGHLNGNWREAEDFDIPGFAESSALRALEEAEEEEGEEHSEEEEVRDTLPNSFNETQSIAAGVGFIGDRGFFSLAVKQTEALYGLPGGHEHEHEEGDEGEGGEAEEEEEEENPFIDLEQTRFDVAGRLDLDGPFEAVTFNAGVADYEHTEFEAPGEAGTVFSNEGWEGRVELLQAENNGWKAAYGLQYREREFSAIGEEAFVPPTESTQFGIFTFQSLTRGPWTGDAALRFERTDHERSGDGFERGFDGVSVSVGGRYQASENTTIGGTIFRTERAPITEELFANGPHLATDQFEIGNERLEEEVATGIEFGARFENDRGHIAANVFYTDYSEFVYLRETGEEEDGLAVAVFTAEDAQFAGFEVEAEAFLGEAGGWQFSGDAVLDVVNAELDVDGPDDTLPRIPPLGLTVGLDADCTEWNLSLRGEIEHAGEQDETAFRELPTDSFTLFNTYASWRPQGEETGLVLTLAGLNLFDEEARVHTSFLKDEVPLPGRNIRFTVGYDF